MWVMGDVGRPIDVIFLSIDYLHFVPGVFCFLCIWTEAMTRFSASITPAPFLSVVLIHLNLRCPRFCRLHECFFLSFSSPSLPSMWVNVPANPWWTVEIFGTLTYSTGSSSVTESFFFLSFFFLLCLPQFDHPVKHIAKLEGIFEMSANCYRLKWSLKAGRELRPAGAHCA